jgi:eukaryotic-like serine/threonine-protein kinase
MGGGHCCNSGHRAVRERLVVFSRKTHALTDKDTIVLADFSNTTGDPVFDDTLRQGLSVQLEQSPFLSMVSNQRIQQTLQMMGQKPDVKLTPEIARELCKRTSSTAAIDGSIAKLGSQYVLGLRAVNCRTGDLLAERQVRATDKEHVLLALDNAAASLRQELGESLSTVQKFYTPVEQVTTPSLEALQAYSQGRKLNEAGHETGAPLFQQAVRLDPNFAMAYAALGVAYSNIGETSQAAENTRKAYELRDRVSMREKFLIESRYYEFVTGDLEKALQAYLLWGQTYPRDAGPPQNLVGIYGSLGQYDNALARGREALRLDPANGLNYANLVNTYINLDRLEEARTTAEEAQKKNLDSMDLRWYLYFLAFAKNDAVWMAQQAAWLAGKPGGQAGADALEADSAFYFGRLEKARELSRRAVNEVLHFQLKELAPGVEAEAALREALFGNASEARQRATAALRLSRGRDVQHGAALALAFAGMRHSCRN